MDYEITVQVPFFLGTKDGELSLANCVNVMLAVSEAQLENAGAGIEALSQHNVGWVITQYDLEMHAAPRVDVPLIVGTRATTYNKLMTYRDYWINDADGTRLVTMHGAWVMMDLSTRKIVPMIADFPGRVGATADTKVQRYPRVTHLEGETIDAPYRVRYFDIDSNGHVNNAHYMEWMQDSLGSDFLSQHRLTHLNLKFAREVADGTTILARQQITDSGEMTLHRIETDGELNAEAEMHWVKREF